MAKVDFHVVSANPGISTCNMATESLVCFIIVKKGHFFTTRITLKVVVPKAVTFNQTRFGKYYILQI